MTTADVAPPELRPPIRLRAVPRCDPPYDDEIAPEDRVGANQLALHWPATTRSSRPPPTPAAQELARKIAVAQASDGGTSGDAKLAVRQFVQVCIEVMNGFRPAAHLRRLATPKDAAGVVAQAVVGSSRVAALPGRGTAGRRSRRAGAVAVTKFHICEPRPGAVEAAVLLVTGDRTLALALRMELHCQAWAATALRLV